MLCECKPLLDFPTGALLFIKTFYEAAETEEVLGAAAVEEDPLEASAPEADFADFVLLLESEVAFACSVLLSEPEVEAGSAFFFMVPYSVAYQPVPLRAKLV